ncbi:MAG: phosphotransferase, partial [Actinomycetota bacterium]|nr:phosphotransferase [Actinomycetota bacterium]
MTLPAKESQRLDPLTATPPQFALEEASAVAKLIFGVTGAVFNLDSERDQNVRLVSKEGTSYLLKLSNPADESEVLDLQTSAMLHIRQQDPALPVMQPLPTRDGGYWGGIDGPDGCRHFVRLFTFVEGRTVDPPGLGRHALGGFGATVGRMGLALRGLFHPAAGYKILWDLKHTPELRAIVDAVEDATRRSMVERVLDRFDRHVRPALPGVRAQLIHNDLTLDNVLLDRSLRVSGIVDFGDLTHTALICDLAVSLVSLMWGRGDPLEAAEAAIRGYTSIAPIEDGEANMLADLVSARLAALVVIANWRVRRYPGNARYIRANEELAWALLERLDTLGRGVVERRMRAACTARRGLRPSSRRASDPSSVEDLIGRRQRVLGPALSPLSYDRPLLLERAEGVTMFDREGTPYLDAYNNVPVVG